MSTFSFVLPTGVTEKLTDLKARVSLPRGPSTVTVRLFADTFTCTARGSGGRGARWQARAQRGGEEWGEGPGCSSGGH
jgi:hypothetical protein